MFYELWITSEVGVVRTVDEVLGQRQGHVLVDAVHLRVEDVVHRGEQVVQEVLERQVGLGALPMLLVPARYKKPCHFASINSASFSPRDARLHCDDHVLLDHVFLALAVTEEGLERAEADATQDLVLTFAILQKYF